MEEDPEMCGFWQKKLFLQVYKTFIFDISGSVKV